MEDQELKLLWKQYDKKLNEFLTLNYKNMEDIGKLKASSALRPVRTIKIVSVVLGFLWILFLGFLLVHSLEFSKPFFIISVGILFVIYAIAVGIYIKHLVLISQFDASKTVMEAQQKLASLQTSLLRVVRLLFLSIPLYSTWYLTFDWIKNAPVTFWLIQVPIILFFTFLGIWLYKNINYKNSHKKWFRLLFNSPEWTGMIKAREFLDQIKEYKKED